MSVGAVKYETCIDWIKLEICLSKPSNFWTVQNLLRSTLGLPEFVNLFVEALDGGGGGAASVFSFRLQNINRIQELRMAIVALDNKFGLTRIRPVAIEIAFDTYLTSPNINELAKLAVDRFRFITSAPKDDWYFYRRQGENRAYTNTLIQRRDLIEHFQTSWQLTDTNNKEADVRYHAYVKTRDNGQALDPSRYRARIEITLQGEALPFSNMDELLAFNFSKLAKYFKFRRIADSVHPAAKYALTNWSGRQHGRIGRYRRIVPSRVGKYSGISLYRSATVADDVLNTEVYECLRKFTRKWRSNRDSADFPEDF